MTLEHPERDLNEVGLVDNHTNIISISISNAKDPWAKKPTVFPKF
jgi:hypothetical protein